MSGISLYDYQKDALNRIKNGSIVCGKTGSGKSRTGLAYYYIHNGGEISDTYVAMESPQDLYIITTAKKRDEHEWDSELSPFMLSVDPELNFYTNKVVIDSWNNIKKYEKVENAFFIFDEQRAVGKGTWSKMFIKIAKHNDWIMLSATPGDNWNDYVPVFIANGFFKNRTQFNQEHAVFSPYIPGQIDHFVSEGRLCKFRRDILVDMDYVKPTVIHDIQVEVKWNSTLYKDTMKNRWNPYKEEPIENISELCYTVRKIVNSDPSRLDAVFDICKDRDRVIIFYNFDYELEMLHWLFDEKREYIVAEWNGHKHEEIPKSKKWIYLVQYTAGAEGWNCTLTDTLIFFSQSYSYKTLMQAKGRIDRLNTPYKDLYYYHLRSKAPIDLGILRALQKKKNFNTREFFGGF